MRRARLPLREGGTQAPTCSPRPARAVPVGFLRRLQQYLQGTLQWPQESLQSDFPADNMSQLLPANNALRALIKRPKHRHLIMGCTLWDPNQGHGDDLTQGMPMLTTTPWDCYWVCNQFSLIPFFCPAPGDLPGPAPGALPALFWWLGSRHFPGPPIWQVGYGASGRGGSLPHSSPTSAPFWVRLGALESDKSGLSSAPMRSKNGWEMREL